MAARRSLLAVAAILVVLLIGLPAMAQRRPSPASRQSSTPLVINTEPNAIVWIDDVRRGVTDDSGKLSLGRILPGRHVVRVRAQGFKETSSPLLPGKRSLTVKLVRTTDAAELMFQQAEDAREKARDDPARQRAAQLYRDTLQIRRNYPAAHVGLARVLLDLNKNQEALDAIEAARNTRAVYPEASAVEGRILKEAAFTEEAIAAFNRSIREAKGFQPEAHVGLARVFEEQGKHDEAVTEYNKALAQLSDSEPVIYQLLGAAYEKQQKYKEAVAAYEKYLLLAPNGSLAPAVRSIIDQVRREAAGNEIIP